MSGKTDEEIAAQADCIHHGTLSITGGACFVAGERGKRGVHPECAVAALRYAGRLAAPAGEDAP